jgi:hypothetical protein
MGRNSPWAYWRYYGRYGTDVIADAEKFEEALIYDGQTSASGTHSETLTAMNASFTAYTEVIDADGGFKPIISKDLYTGLGAAGGTYQDVTTGVSSSTATVYTLILQGGFAK